MIRPARPRIVLFLPIREVAPLGGFHCACLGANLERRFEGVLSGCLSRQVIRLTSRGGS